VFGKNNESFLTLPDAVPSEAAPEFVLNLHTRPELIYKKYKQLKLKLSRYRHQTGLLNEHPG
jgi:hypothetical protein